MWNQANKKYRCGRKFRRGGDDKLNFFYVASYSMRNSHILLVSKDDRFLGAKIAGKIVNRPEELIRVSSADFTSNHS